MAILWHPTATRKLYSARGKPWKGGSGKPKFVFHTTETAGLPNYAAPPHMTLHPGVRLYQHIPFNLAAYSVRSGKVDTMQFAYQIEVIGRAREVPNYRNHPWYLEVADLIDWFHDNLGVPIVFEDFHKQPSYGQFAWQRRNYATVDAFSGILGHCHVGRGIDSHWDPGKLDVERLEAMIGSAPPPPPPDPEEDDMATWLTTLQRQDEAYFVSLAAQTGSPGGADPGYWGRSHNSDGVRVAPSPDDGEWTRAVDEIATAALSVGISGSGGDGDLSRGDQVTLN